MRADRKRRGAPPRTRARGNSRRPRGCAANQRHAEALRAQARRRARRAPMSVEPTVPVPPLPARATHDFPHCAVKGAMQPVGDPPTFAPSHEAYLPAKRRRRAGQRWSPTRAHAAPLSACGAPGREYFLAPKRTTPIGRGGATAVRAPRVSWASGARELRASSTSCHNITPARRRRPRGRGRGARTRARASRARGGRRRRAARLPRERRARTTGHRRCPWPRRDAARRPPVVVRRARRRPSAWQAASTVTSCAARTLPRCAPRRAPRARRAAAPAPGGSAAPRRSSGPRRERGERRVRQPPREAPRDEARGGREPHGGRGRTRRARARRARRARRPPPQPAAPRRRADERRPRASSPAAPPPAPAKPREKSAASEKGSASTSAARSASRALGRGEVGARAHLGRQRARPRPGARSTRPRR